MVLKMFPVTTIIVSSICLVSFIRWDVVAFTFMTLRMLIVLLIVEGVIKYYAENQ